jgi:hypothetical protein
MLHLIGLVYDKATILTVLPVRRITSTRVFKYSEDHIILSTKTCTGIGLIIEQTTAPISVISNPEIIDEITLFVFKFRVHHAPYHCTIEIFSFIDSQQGGP